MAEATQFTIGAEASCGDAVCGEVTRLVVDPVARSVTHLVVEPKHRRGLGRLVPVELIDASDGRAELHCTLVEFEKLDDAEENRFVSWPANNSGYGSGPLTMLPYYELGLAGGPTEIYDSLPLGEVSVRRGEHVHATDGEIGQVQGLVIEPESHPRDACAPSRGTPVGTQTSCHPDHSGSKRRRRYTSQHYETGGPTIATGRCRSARSIGRLSGLAENQYLIASCIVAWL